MSKKHYQAIARAIHTLPVAGTETGPEFRKAFVRDVVICLSDIFKADNPAFSRERFQEACETGTTRGMRS